MSILLNIICPKGIISATDTREVYSKIDKLGKKVFISHLDGISKSYVKGKYLISISGNAYINSLQIKDIFPDFLNKLEDQISFTQLINEIFKLYQNSIKYHSVTDKIDTVLKEKRTHIDTNQFTIDSSIDFINTTISDVQLIFEEQDEYSTIGGVIDLFIQTEKGIETRNIER